MTVSPHDITHPDHQGHDHFLRVQAVAKALGLHQFTNYLYKRYPEIPQMQVGWSNGTTKLLLGTGEIHNAAAHPDQKKLMLTPDKHYDRGYSQGYFNQALQANAIADLSRSQVESATAKLNKALSIVSEGLNLLPIESWAYFPKKGTAQDLQAHIGAKLQNAVYTEDSAAPYHRVYAMAISCQL